MKITVAGKQERLLIESLCDLALKEGGMKNLLGVERVLNAIEDEPIKKVKLPPEE